MVVELGATLENFKAHLNKTGDAENDELERVLRAATSITENDPEVGIGPIVNRSVTSRRTWSSVGAVLPVGPVVSVETIAGDHGDYTGDDVVIDDAGILTNVLGGTIAHGDYDVTYTAGWAATTEDVPDDIQLAVCIIGKHLWETQRGRTANRVGTIADGESMPMGFLVPHRAAAILRGRRPYGVAFA